MGIIYQKYLILLKKWPFNAANGELDFAFHLRELLKTRQGDNIFPGDRKQNEKIMESLTRLASNKYADLYPKKYKLGANGLPLATLNTIFEDEILGKNRKRKLFGHITHKHIRILCKCFNSIVQICSPFILVFMFILDVS